MRGVFDSVAPKYDVMNDLMSAGLHRVWKKYTITVANPQLGDQVLDIAGGTGDLSLAFAGKVGPTGRVVHTDINEAMLREGRNRLLDKGVVLPTMVCDAEKLPFASESFNIVTVAFGLRNMTHKDQALAEMLRVLKPGGKLLVLEFSKVAKPLEKAYDWYSFNVLPKLGQLVAGDAAQLPVPGRVDPHASGAGRAAPADEVGGLWARGCSQPQCGCGGVALGHQVLMSADT